MPVVAVKRGGKWRVVEKATGKLASKKGEAVDGGGHGSKEMAMKQAQKINISLHKRGKI